MEKHINTMALAGHVLADNEEKEATKQYVQNVLFCFDI